MLKAVDMPKELPDEEQGRVGKISPLTPSLDQIAEDMKHMDTMFAAMVRIAGGIEWLAAAMDEKPSYASKISEGMYGRNGKTVQLRWLAPMFDDPKATEVLMLWLSERCGFEPPVRKRVVTPEQLRAAVTEVVAEMPETVKQGVRAEAARRLGIRPEDLKL